MIKWIKPSGIEIETNDRKETVEYCVKLGWKRADDEREPELIPDPEPVAADADNQPTKRKRRTKAEMEAAKLDNENQ